MNKHSLKHMTYQPLQTLAFSEENIEKFKRLGCSYLDSLACLNNFVKLLPAAMREAVMIYPQLALDGYVKKTGQVAYRKQKMMLRGGALPNAGKFYAITCDPIDLFGGNGLKAGECCCAALPEGKTIMIRYPHTSEASWVVLNNKHIEMGITDKNVMVLNNYDDSLRRLGGADYDGDKVFVVTDEDFHKIISETLDEMGNPTQMPNTPAGHAKKVTFDKTTAKNIRMAYFTNLIKPSQIGSVSNKLSCAYSDLYDAYVDGDEARVADAKACVEYWQKKVEITVDIEKHGDTDLPMPKAVKKMTKKMPTFIKFAKIAKNIGKPVKDVVDETKYEQKANHPLEQYSIFINEHTKKMAEFGAKINGEFFWENLMYDAQLPSVQNTKVFKRSEPLRDENGKIVKDESGNTKYVNGGQFDQLVFATSDELREMAASRNLEYTTIIDLRKQMIEKLMALYAEKYGCTVQHVYNLIVYYIYTMNEGPALETYKRVLWDCLNDYIVDALSERFGSLALSAVIDLDDLDDCEDDDDEDEEMPW